MQGERTGEATTVGAVGSQSAIHRLQDVGAAIEEPVTVRECDATTTDVDRVVVLPGTDETTAHATVDDAVAAAAREGAPPVVLVAPSEAEIGPALAAGVTEYLPRSLLAERPETVLRRTLAAAEPAGGPADIEALCDAVAEPLTLHDPETGTVVHANERLCALLGYDRSELIAMRVGDYTADVDGYDQTTATELITSATTEGAVGPVEWPLRTADGEQVWVESTLRPVTVDGRELVLSTATEVTDRRRQRRQLREIAAHIDEVVYLAQADLSEVLFVNDAYTELFGQPVERVYEDPLAVLEAVHPEDRAAYRADLTAMSEHVRSEPEEPYEFSHRLRVDGETRWVEVTGFPSRGPGGTVDRGVGVVRDVTERVRRQREYEQIFNEVNDAITVHDPETAEMVAVNETFCEMVGYGRETVLDMEITDFSRDDLGYTTERGREFIRSVGDDGGRVQTEWALETADGDTVWVEVHGTLAEIGGRRRFVAIDRDITEAKRREREYEQIFDGVNDAIAVHDPETGEIVDVNEQYVELYGYDRETLLDAGMDRLSVPEEGYTDERARELVTDVAEEGTDETVEWRIETADGERRTIESKLTVAEVGGERRVLSLIRDVTERLRREQEYEQIFHGVTDGIAVHDPETGAMEAVNDTLCELTGYDREAVLERGAEGLLVDHPDASDPAGGIQAVMDRVMAGETVEPYEQPIETADGELVWLEIDPSRAVIGGEERFVAIARDVTERRDREERVQVLNRVLRHNLRNEIDAVQGFATAIEEATDATAIHEHARRIHRTADALLELGAKARATEAVLRGEARREVGPVGQVVQTAVAEACERLPGADPVVRVARPVADSQVEATVLRLVVTEVVENALQHGAEPVTVEVTRGDEGGEDLTVTVSDSGPGIPDRVLTPVRAGRETQLEHNQGLGLWLVNWGVRRLDGSVTFDRPPQGGTTVRLSVPVVDG